MPVQSTSGVKQWFTRRWDAQRRLDRPADLATRRRRVAPIRDQILATLPFEDRSGLGTTTAAGGNETTVVAMRDRYGFQVRLALCHQTGLVFLLDRLTREGYDRFYKDGVYRQLIAAYHDESGHNLVERQHEQALKNGRVVFSALVNELTLPTGARVLDVGGSTGALSKLMRDAFGANATVVDPSEQELRIASDLGLETRCGTIEQVEFGEHELFDLIVINQTIEHLLDIEQAFVRLRSLLTAEGVLVFDILDFLALLEWCGCVEAASRLEHCQFLYDEMVDCFCSQVGLRVQKRLFHEAGCVLYICGRTEMGGHVAVAPEVLQQVRRRLLAQDVIWRQSALTAPDSLEERIVRTASRPVRSAKRWLSGR